jgi:hypothetical protein
MDTQLVKSKSESLCEENDNMENADKIGREQAKLSYHTPQLTRVAKLMQKLLTDWGEK